MTKSTWLIWAPRILGLAVAVFIGLFALDAFRPGRPPSEGIPDFVIHLLPAIVLLVVVALAWRRPWLGGVVFLLLALVYAISAPARPDWILAIAGPLMLVGLLFLWSWHQHPST